MGATADHFIVTKAVTLHYVEIGQIPRPRRAVPVEVIYHLKKRADPDTDKSTATVQPTASPGSMFFRGKNRNIKDDPFLQRLSRLK